MWTYEAPLRRMNFVIEQVLRAPQAWAATPAFAELDAATAREILEQAGRFAAEVIAPLNSSGDLQGCTLAEGAVKTPDGFPAAYAAFVEGGWPSLACEVEAGGQGLPRLIDSALNEMLAAANHAWVMYPGLLHGAYESVYRHAVPAVRDRWLPGIVSGATLSTMNLTEPHAGSDLGLVRTRAQGVAEGPVANGDRVLVSGQKIFISGGDQDMTEQIVHLVLCRLPDAPPGTRGLSLALVPKWLDAADVAGTPLASVTSQARADGRVRNAAYCDGIEKKMGIKGSATCAMRFDGALGWLVGEPHRGLAAMFLMMNAARLHVGLQGLGHLEAATQNATAYALDRRQMRAPSRPSDTSGTPAVSSPDPIAWHPAMRRTLLGLRAKADAARVLAYHTAMRLDVAEHDPDPQARARAHDDVGLLTPVVKAFLTDLGHRGADEALGVFGGYGFVHEYAIEQAVRDSRIAMIYEGTNEIQAIDLLTRKVLADGGERLGRLLDDLAADATAAPGAFSGALLEQVLRVREATAALLAGRDADPEWPLRAADDYLSGVGHALFAWAWARIATAAAPAAETDAWAAQQLAVARHGIERVLPDAMPCWARVHARDAALGWVAA